MNILETMNDEQLFARWFRGDSWRFWRLFLALLFGLSVNPADMPAITAATGRKALFTSPITEAWALVGRRGGKSIIAALVVVYLACFVDYAPFIALGEVVTIMLVAADRKQARTVLRYVRAFVLQTALLKSRVTRVTKESIEFGGVVIEIHTASGISTRSYTLGGVVNDEIAYFPAGESVNADAEILTAQRPALATIPGALMLNISTGYARRGSVYSAFEEHHGKDSSDVLFWKAPSRSLEPDALVQMNPKLDLRIVQKAYDLDPIAAGAEWGAGFRSDCERLFTLELLDSITDYDRPLILAPDSAELQ
jgi:hypothetical protein